MGWYDGFEDGDLSEWSVTNYYSGSTIEATSTSPIANTYSLRVYTPTDSNENLTRSVSGHQQNTDYYIRVDQQSGGSSDNADFRLLNASGIAFASVDFRGNGDIVVEGGSIVTSYSEGTIYHVRIIPDFTNNTYAVEIDGSQVTSDVTFATSASETASIYIGQNLGATNDMEVYYDDITSGPIPPDAPSSLSATASADDISLSWTDNSNSEDGCRIYRAQTSGSATTDYTQINTVGANTSSYTDTALEDGERYYYRVTAYNAGGESDVSNEANATTALPTPTLDSLDAATENEITVSWTKTDDSSNGSWSVDVSTDGGSSWSTVVSGLGPTITSYTHTGLLDGEQYTYRVTRNTDHASKTTGTMAATTILPAPTNVSSTLK